MITLSLCSYVGMYNALRIFELWFFHVLMLSVYIWGYFWPTYIRRSNVSVLAGSGCYSESVCCEHLCVCLCVGIGVCMSPSSYLTASPQWPTPPEPCSILKVVLPSLLSGERRQHSGEFPLLPRPPPTTHLTSEPPPSSVSPTLPPRSRRSHSMAGVSFRLSGFSLPPCKCLGACAFNCVCVSV